MGKPCWRVKTDPSSSILKAQLLVQASILSGCCHGHPGHAYNVITNIVHWLWPCPPPSLSLSPKRVTAAALSERLRDITVTASLRFLIRILTLIPLTWPRLQGEAPGANPNVIPTGGSQSTPPPIYLFTSLHRASNPATMSLVLQAEALVHVEVLQGP